MSGGNRRTRRTISNAAIATSGSSREMIFSTAYGCREPRAALIETISPVSVDPTSAPAAKIAKMSTARTRGENCDSPAAAAIIDSTATTPRAF